jgi:hypothetical protein
MLARAMNATRRLGEPRLTLLDAANDALVRPTAPRGPIAKILADDPSSNEPVLRLLLVIATAVDQLRQDVDFREAAGAEVRHALPRGVISHYVPPDPGAVWALNLALLAQESLLGGFPLPSGLVSRVLFRSDLETDELAHTLVDGATAALVAGYELFDKIEPELARGRDALKHLSRNARARDAWLQVVALGAITRRHLAHGLRLSRAGADIQAAALEKAGLVTLTRGGRIERRHCIKDPPLQIATTELNGAVADLDASLAEIDRLLSLG